MLDYTVKQVPEADVEKVKESMRLLNATDIEAKDNGDKTFDISCKLPT